MVAHTRHKASKVVSSFPEWMQHDDLALPRAQRLGVHTLACKMVDVKNFHGFEDGGCGLVVYASVETSVSSSVLGQLRTNSLDCHNLNDGSRPILNSVESAVRWELPSGWVSGDRTAQS